MGNPLSVAEVLELQSRGLITKDRAGEIIECLLHPPRLVVGGALGDLGSQGEIVKSGVVQHITVPNDQNLATPWPPAKQWTLYDKLKMRLNLQADATFGFDFLHIFNSGRKIFVFIVHGDEPAYIEEDDPAMFPTDAFMARYYLVREKLTGDGKPPFPGSSAAQQQRP
jgi:hypothetical protein